MTKIPNSKTVYAIDEKTLYLKGDYLNYFSANGKFNCSKLSFHGLKVIKESIEGLTVEIIDDDWCIRELEYHEAVFTINHLGYSKFLEYL